MALVSGQPIPPHLPYSKVTTNSGALPSFLGYVELVPTADAAYTLPALVSSPPILSGTLLYLKNSSAFIVTITPAGGDAITGGTGTIQPYSTLSLITTNAKVWNIASAASDLVSVKAFGAKGDGASDDTQSLQRAMNSAAGKFTLYVDPGTYMVTTLSIPLGGKLHMLGAGESITTIAQMQSAASGASLIVAPIVASSYDDFLMSDMTLDGRADVNLPGYGLHLIQGYILKDWRFYRIVFKNSVAYGVGLQGYPEAGANKNGPQTDITFDTCQWIRCGSGRQAADTTTLAAALNSSSLSFDVADGTKVTSSVIRIDNEIMRGASVAGNTVTVLTRGVYGTTAAAHSSGATVYNCGDTDSVDIKSSQRVTFRNCSSKWSGKGYNVRCSDLRFIGCTAYECGNGFDVNAARPNEADYPASLLVSTINASDTALTLVSSAGFPASGFVRIDLEMISYAAVAGNQLTGLVRGLRGTFADTHTANVQVSYYANIHTYDTKATMSACTAENNFGAGFLAWCTVQNSETYVSYDGCHARSNEIGFSIQGPQYGSTQYGWVYATYNNCHSTYNTNTGINVRAAAALNITGCDCSFNTTGGINIEYCPNGGSVDACTLRANNVGLSVNNGSNRFRVGDNNAFGNTTDQIRFLSVTDATNYGPVYNIVSGTGSTTYAVATASAAWTPGTITNGSFASVAITPVPGSGSLRGQPSIGAFSLSIPSGCFIQATAINATDMRVSIFNLSGADVNLGAGTASVTVFRNILM